VTVTACGLIIDAHLSALPTLTGWDLVTVAEGPLLRQDPPGRWCTIGWVSDDTGPQVSFVPVPDAQGGARESGTIGCGLYVAADDVTAARATLLPLVGAWAGWLTTDRGMGERLVGDSEAHLDADLTLGVTRSSGGLATARVTITYTAHTYG
jgi:hypothetical protein